MSQLSQTLHYKLDGTTDEITLYSTLAEVNNKGLNVKVNGINAYAGYGSAADGEVSRMNYKPPTEVAQKVLKQAGEPVLLNLLGYRNNEDLLQALPITRVTKGSYVHFNNENAPTISGYDFVCAVPNCFIAEEDTTVKIYYIPQSVPDRERTDWSHAFEREAASGDLSLQDFANTFNAEKFYYFFGYSFVTKLPKLNTSKVTTMEDMFASCGSLETLDLRFLDTTNVTNMRMMFSLCKSLQTLDLSYLNISNVTNMMGMFWGCMALKTLNLSSLDTSKVTNMQALFTNCYELETLNLSSFDTSKVRSFNTFFQGTSKLKTVSGVLDLTSCRSVSNMFLDSSVEGVHLKNVSRSVDFSKSAGTEGTTYIIDNYID